MSSISIHFQIYNIFSKNVDALNLIVVVVVVVVFLLLLSIGPRWLMPRMYCSHIGLLYYP